MYLQQELNIYPKDKQERPGNVSEWGTHHPKLVNKEKCYVGLQGTIGTSRFPVCV
jgi:hypothetical protein